MKINRLKHVALGMLVGIGVVVGMIFLPAKILGNSPRTVYAGKPIRYWEQQLTNRDAGAGNAAFSVVNAQVIPQLLDTIFHDTNDSRLRITLIDALPGVQIRFLPSETRRAYAARDMGFLGPAARSAMPVMLEALKGKDPAVRHAAVYVLGKTRCDPEVVIPLLIGYLEDDDLNEEAALALANYGRLAKAAVPKLIPLLSAPHKDSRTAAREALLKIDPEAYTNAAGSIP
jgi:hypothetical protein